MVHTVKKHTVVIGKDKLDDLQTRLLHKLIMDKNCLPGGIINKGCYFVNYFNGSNFIKYKVHLGCDIEFCGQFQPSIDKTSKVLNFISENAKSSVGLQSIKYYAPPDNKNHNGKFYLLDDIYLDRFKYGGIHYIDVIDDTENGLAASGVYGELKKYKGTIKPNFFNKDDLRFFPAKDKRLAKHMMATNTATDYVTVYDEEKLSKRAIYLKARNLEPIFDVEKDSYILSISKIDGVDLSNYIKYDDLLSRSVGTKPKRSPPLKGYVSNHVTKLSNTHQKLMSVEDRINLSIQLLREYKYAIQNNRIYHRDIKPENIMVLNNSAFNNWRIRYIDFGLSCDEKDRKKIAGTILFLPPEVLIWNSYSKADIYAVGRVIGLVWRDDELDQYFGSGISESEFAAIRSNQGKIYFSLFNGLDVPDKIGVAITNAIIRMTDCDLRKRSDILTAINDFEAIRLKYWINENEKKHPELVNHLKAAHSHALTLVSETENILLAPDEYAQRVIYFVNQIDDNPSVLKLFLKTVGFDALTECQNKSEVINKVNDIVNRYMTSRIEFEKNIDHYDKSGPDNEGYQLYIKHCRELYARLVPYRMDLDLFCELTDHLKRKNIKIQDAYSYYINLDKTRKSVSLKK
ncbi:MAG TPA: hypothetical protein VL360_04140 [Gammaproteobacteria bacterium]|jgi:serine/threonine protein kinase|nr:hypothetical protein [Gammaproteobacteria bacterium]